MKKFCRKLSTIEERYGKKIEALTAGQDERYHIAIIAILKKKYYSAPYEQ